MATVFIVDLPSVIARSADAASRPDESSPDGERRRAQRAIVEASAEVARLGIPHDLSRVAGRLQIACDHLAEREPFGARDLDRAVERGADRSVRHGPGHVLGGDGLEAGRRRTHPSAVGAGSSDRAEELEELRRPYDRVGDARLFDEPLLGQLRAEVAAVRRALGADHGECDVMTDGCISLRAREIAARILEEGENRRVLEGRRVRDVHDHLGAGQRLPQTLAGRGVHAGPGRRGEGLVTLPLQPAHDPASDQAAASEHDDLHGVSPTRGGSAAVELTSNART
jgi:hypothetical protein